jgi:hypothetical protein
MGLFRFDSGQPDLELDHFEPSEFGEWSRKMDRSLLLKLDDFRQRWGAPVHISPVDGALGRKTYSSSMHSYARLGRVCAADVFPQGMTPELFPTAYTLAKQAGFGGIGIYTDTKFQGRDWPMLHVDVRAVPRGDPPASWSRIAGEYDELALLMPEGWAR